MGKLYVLRNHGYMCLNPAFSILKLFMNFKFKKRNRAATNVTCRGHSFRLLLYGRKTKRGLNDVKQPLNSISS